MARSAKTKILLSTIGLIIGVYFSFLSYFEPTPGKHSWLTGLAGDWAIKVGQTDYEIGNSVSKPDMYVVFRYAPVTLNSGDQKEIIETVVDGVNLYSYDPNFIVATTKDGYSWINLKNSQVKSVKTLGQIESDELVHIRLLSDSLRKPEPSDRYIFAFVGAGLLLTTVALLLRTLIKSRQIYRPIKEDDK